MDGQRGSHTPTTVPVQGSRGRLGRIGQAVQMRMSRITLSVLGVLLLTPVLSFLNVEAAASFASPAFQRQWNAGEAITPNFWGPLELAKNGQMEPYVETGGMRLVQYFDKARMEIGAGGTVTNGLLATELITGNRQLGDTSFQNFGPAAIPVAGDPDNAGPTYAAIQSNAAQLRSAVASTPNAPVTRALTPAGALTTFASGTTFAQANISGYDGVTQHNVPTAFVNYRATAGIPAIGLAISEPFWSNVKVAGAQKDVLIQAFERRVLTFTPSNPAAFQVEFGNIGSHYFTWRYMTNTGGGTGTTTGGTGTTNPPQCIALQSQGAALRTQYINIAPIGGVTQRSVFENQLVNLRATFLALGCQGDFDVSLP